MNIIKSIGAVLAGFVAVAILSVAIDAVLEGIGFFPAETDPTAWATWMLALALLYRSASTVLGGYITARLAPGSPMKHVYVLAVLGLVGGTVGAIDGWSFGHHWYPIALTATGPLFVILGGSLRKQN